MNFFNEILGDIFSSKLLDTGLEKQETPINQEVYVLDILLACFEVIEY